MVLSNSFTRQLWEMKGVLSFVTLGGMIQPTSTIGKGKSDLISTKSDLICFCFANDCMISSGLSKKKTKKSPTSYFPLVADNFWWDGSKVFSAHHWEVCCNVPNVGHLDAIPHVYSL